MKLISAEEYNQKRIIVFDIDNTLAPSRLPLDQEMAGLLKKVLQKKQVAIISGEEFEDIEKRILNQLVLNDEEKKSLMILPTCGGALYIYNKNWEKVYSHILSETDKKEITGAINEIEKNDPNLFQNKIFGEKIQDRESEITYSALGKDAPLELKKAWDPDFKKRIILQKKLQEKLPDFEIKIGGTTSIDITPQGIDKTYGIKKLLDFFQFEKDELLYFGDAVYNNGNDYPVVLLGIETIKVSNEEETKKIIHSLLE